MKKQIQQIIMLGDELLFTSILDRHRDIAAGVAGRAGRGGQRRRRGRRRRLEGKALVGPGEGNDPIARSPQ